MGALEVPGCAFEALAGTIVGLVPPYERSQPHHGMLTQRMHTEEHGSLWLRVGGHVPPKNGCHSVTNNVCHHCYPSSKAILVQNGDSLSSRWVAFACVLSACVGFGLELLGTLSSHAPSFL